MLIVLYLLGVYINNDWTIGLIWQYVNVGEHLTCFCYPWVQKTAFFEDIIICNMWTCGLAAVLVFSEFANW